MIHHPQSSIIIPLFSLWLKQLHCILGKFEEEAVGSEHLAGVGVLSLTWVSCR